MSVDTMHNNENTVSLADIAEIKTKLLHEIKAEDLLITDKFNWARSNLAGSKYTHSTFLAGLLDDSPQFLDSVNIEYLRRADIDPIQQYLDIFHQEQQSVDRVKAEKEPDEGWMPPDHGSVIANNLRGFLLREVKVVRLRAEWKDRFLVAYVQQQVESNLPRLLDSVRPEVTFDPGCNIPNRTNPPTDNLLGACPIKTIPLHEQIDTEGSAFTTADHALNELVRPFYIHLNDILNLLAEETIQVTKLLAKSQVVASLPPPLPGQSVQPFVKGLWQCLKLLAGLENSPGKPTVQIIASWERLKQLLAEHGSWGNGKTALFERIVVARLAFALPGPLRNFVWKQVEETRAKASARDMGILSHNIKGLLASAVINPLLLMKQRGIGDNAITEEALRGAGLLRDMVNAINLSQGGTKEDFLADLRDPDEKALSLKTILFSSLRAAFTNMFDSKYFNRYYSVHFPEADSFYEARKVFVALSSDDTGALLDFGRRYLRTTITWDCLDTVVAAKIGNRRNSALKLLILFQEIFMNAVKNATFTEFERRSLAFAGQHGKETMEFTVSNSFDQAETRTDTRLGQGIINGLLRQFEAVPVITKQDGLFSIRFSLPCAPAAGGK